MREKTWGWLVLLARLGGASGPLQAEDLGCVSTTSRVLGANDQIGVSAFDDPNVPGGKPRQHILYASAELSWLVRTPSLPDRLTYVKGCC
jgi:catabolite regulation protein CreA